MKNVSTKIINDRYQLIEKIGVGGIGDVFLAQDLKLSRKVVIKIVRLELLSNVGVGNRIDRECQIHASLEHPNIVTFHDRIVTQDNTYIVLEYVSGETLSSYIQRCCTDEQKLSPESVVNIVLQILEALAFIHQHNIIHGDIKPSNIMVHKLSNGRLLVKLMDFGIAAVEIGDETLTKIHNYSAGDPGTPAYMAPERFDSQGFYSLGSPSDLYSVGVVLYELLAGIPPFVGAMTEIVSSHLLKEPDWSKFASQTPQQLTSIIQKALAKNPSQRYQSALEFAAVLKDFLILNNSDTFDPDKTVLRTTISSELIAKDQSQYTSQSLDGTEGGRHKGSRQTLCIVGSVCFAVLLIVLIPSFQGNQKIRMDKEVPVSGEKTSTRSSPRQIENQYSTNNLTSETKLVEKKVAAEASGAPLQDLTDQHKTAGNSNTVQGIETPEVIVMDNKKTDLTLSQNSESVKEQAINGQKKPVYKPYSWKNSSNTTREKQNLNSALQEFVTARKALKINHSTPKKVVTTQSKVKNTTVKNLASTKQKKWKTTKQKTADTSKCSTLLKSYQLGDSSGIQEYIQTCSQ